LCTKYHILNENCYKKELRTKNKSLCVEDFATQSIFAAQSPLSPLLVMLIQIPFDTEVIAMHGVLGRIKSHQ